MSAKSKNSSSGELEDFEDELKDTYADVTNHNDYEITDLEVTTYTRPGKCIKALKLPVKLNNNQKNKMEETIGDLLEKEIRISLESEDPAGTEGTYGIYGRDNEPI